MTEATEETEETESSDDRAPGGRTVPAGALVVAIMVAAALGILAIVALTFGSGDDDGDTEAVRLAAGRFAERLLTVEESRLDEWKSGVLSLSTGGFAEEVDEVESSFRRLITEAELEVQAQVTEVFLGEIDDGQVSAVLTYDRAVQDSSGTRTESDRYLQLRLLRVDGEWLVDNVVDIVSAQTPATSGAAAPTVEGTETPSTTAAPADPGG